jgi:hypothetical protein
MTDPEAPLAAYQIRTLPKPKPTTPPTLPALTPQEGAALAALIRSQIKHPGTTQKP